MPDYGSLTPDRLAASSPVIAPLYPLPPWKLPRSRTLRVIFETDVEPVLKWLPPALSRSSPPYGIMTIAHHPESPVGPFSLASQQIGCRAGFFIRAYTLLAVADNTAAVAGLREIWGHPCVAGEVSLEADAKHASATVAVASATVAAGGSRLVTVHLERLEAIAPGLVRYDPVLNLRAVPSVEGGRTHESLHLVQVDPDYEIIEAARGSAEVVYTDDESHPFSVLPVRNVISATLATVDTELPTARFVMPYEQPR